MQIDNTPAFSAFEADLLNLKNLFLIPGIAVLVKRRGCVLFQGGYGVANAEHNIHVSENTRFPIASLTKVFTSLVVARLFENGDLNPESAVCDYLQEKKIARSIRVKHLMSHTSEGIPGDDFIYNGARFAMLTSIIENVTSKDYAQLLTRYVLEPAQLAHTIPLHDESVLQSLGHSIAKPYNFEFGNSPGHYEFKLTGSSGLISSVIDLARLDDALNNDVVVSAQSKKFLFSPFCSVTNRLLPSGAGFFVQEFSGVNLVWSYGQEDSFSSLLLKVPEKHLTCIVLANNNTLCDPARLLYGDVSYSLFALLFLKHFIFTERQLPAFADFLDPQRLQAVIESNNGHSKKQSDMLRALFLAHTLGFSFVGKTNTADIARANLLLKLTFRYFPNYTEYANLSFMHALTAVEEEIGSEGYGRIIEHIGSLLRVKNPRNPIVNYYLATFFARRGDGEVAYQYYKMVSEHAQPRTWYGIESYYFLARYYRSKVCLPTARKYYEQIIRLNWNYDHLLDKTRSELATL